MVSVAIFKGITAKGLLLASLPLMLTPVLSYFLTPVVIPITATVAAGRRRKRRHANQTDWMIINNDNDTSHQFNFKTITSHLSDIPERKLNEAKVSKTVTKFVVVMFWFRFFSFDLNYHLIRL